MKNYSFLIRFLFFLSCGPFLSHAQVTVQTFTYTGSLQTFTVPACVSTITIEARGAQGGSVYASGSYSGGLGAIMRGTFTVTTGSVLNIIVGQFGNSAPHTSGGGGASGVAISNTPMIVAGGGGGVDYQNPNYSGMNAVVGTAGVQGNNNFGSGGTNGADGGDYIYSGVNISRGGRGWTFNNNGSLGQNGISVNTTTTSGTWGIGGGGGSVGEGYCNCGGGGGGYSGGGSGNINVSGGGGGSYNAGTNQVNTGGAHSGYGIVTFSYTYSGNSIATTPPSTAICVGNSVTLNASGMVSYTWTGGSNASSIVVSPSVTTTYSVQGTNSVGCVSSGVITVTVNQTAPTLTVVNTATNSAGICPGQTVALTASGATTYSWTGGVVNGVAFQPGVPSSYNVTGANACGTATAVTSVSVHPLPPVTASVSQPTICSGASVTVVGGGANSYTWAPSNISNGVPFYPTLTQSYSVTGTSALGCTATAVTNISVTTTPILAPIATPTRICIGESSTITATGAANYSWSPGGQNTSAIVVSPAVTSTYVVLKWNDNCFDSKTITVLVDPLPTVLAFASPSTICLYNTTTLQAGGGTSYTWSPQGGQGPNSFTTIVSPQVSTNYTVTAFDGSCTSTGTVDVIVNQNPTITVSASSSVICQGQPVNLTVSGASNYQWSNNLGTSSSVTDYPSGPTLYTVSGTNASNCTAVVSQVVLVNPLPIITTTVTRPLVCEGGTSTLSAGGAATYSWNAGTNNTGPVTVVNTNVNTVYTVTGSYTTGCINTKTVLVSVFMPTFAVSSNTAVCFGGSVTLVASAANSYTWVNGPQAPSYMVSPPAKTVYTVIATSNSGSVNCTSSNTVEVDIFQNPIVTAVATRTSICRNEFVDLNAGGATAYLWNNNMTGSPISVNPFSTTNYTVTGTDQNGCKNTATVQVRVQTCVGIDENVAGKTLSIYPNPNNGEFTIETESAIHLVLVNELGQLIRNLELNEQNKFKADVKDLANGIYFISGENENYKVHQKIVVSK